MADDFATLVLQLKSSPFKQALDESERDLKSFGGHAAEIIKGIGELFAGGSFLKGAIGAFQEHEKALGSLNKALRNGGDNVDLYAKSFRKLAEEMKGLTGIDDDITLSAMAYGRNLGINASQMEDAAKAAAGLAAKYGMDLSGAMQLLGRASQGSTDMLSRYGIVLDETLTPQQKFQEVLKRGAEAFGLAKMNTSSYSGAIKQLGLEWDDVLKVVGKEAAEFLLPFIKSAGDFLKYLNSMDDATKTFLSRMAIMATSGVAVSGAIKAINGVMGIYNGLLATSAAAMAADTAATTANTAAHSLNSAARGARGLGGSMMMEAAQAAFRRDELLGMAQMSTASKYSMARSAGLDMAEWGRSSSLKTAGSAAAGTLGAYGATKLFPTFARAGAAVSGIGSTIGGAMSGLGIGSGLSGVMSTSLGAVGAAGAGAVAGVAALSAAVFALGGAAGMGISKVTGLRGVLENFYGSKFFGLDEANERSSNLDAQLAKFQEKDAVRKQSQQQKQLEDAQDKKAYEGASWSYSGKVSDSYLRSVASSDFDKQLEILRARQAEVNAKYVSVQGDDYKAKTERLKLDEEIMDLGGRIADVEKRKLAKSQEEDRELFEAQFNRISNNDTEGDSFKISARQIEMLGQRIEADSAELATLTGDAFESAQKNLEKERDRLAALKASAQREAADFAKEVSDSAFDFDLKNTFRPEEQSKKLQDKIGKSLGSIDISDGLSKKEFGSIKEAQSMASQLQELARSQFRPNVRESKMSDAVEKGSMEDYRLRSMTDTKSDNSEAKKAADAAIGIQRKIGELYERMIGTGIKVQIANAANV